MSLKRFYFDKNIEMCRTCMFIDEYTLNVNGNGEIPCGYDGTAICGIYEIGEKETSENCLQSAHYFPGKLPYRAKPNVPSLKLIPFMKLVSLSELPE